MQYDNEIEFILPKDLLNRMYDTWKNNVNNVKFPIIKPFITLYF
jgi:hypothetical protein